MTKGTMKVGKRLISKDELSAEEKGRQVHIYTHRNKICVSVRNVKEQTAFHEFTHSQFCNLFERLKPGIDRVVD